MRQICFGIKLLFFNYLIVNSIQGTLSIKPRYIDNELRKFNELRPL